MRLVNESQIVDTWAPLIMETAGIEDQGKLRWLSKYCHYHALNEQSNDGVINENAYQTLSMIPAMGAIRAPSNPGGMLNFNTGDTGSGDKFPTLLPLAIQVAAKTVGFDVVNVIPMQNPTGVLTYLDYVYAGGRIDSTEKPLLIKIDAPLINSVAYVVGTTYWGVSAAAVDGTPDAYTSGDKAVKMTYVGKSRIDGVPIFRVIGTYSYTSSWASDTSVTIAQVFDGSAIVTGDNGGIPVTNDASTSYAAVTAKAGLVHALEDQVQGFAGAGQTDTGTWFGDAVDGKQKVESMNRETGENTYYRPMGLEVRNKFVAAETVQLAASVTPEMIQDLNKQYGVDVVSMIENALANDISQHINKHILSRLFALGWSNNYEFEKVSGQTLNFRVDGDTNAIAASSGPEYIGKTGALLKVKVNGFQTYGGTANFENLHTIQRRIYSKVLTAGNIIAQRGRRGGANFAITNIQMASALQDCQGFTMAPMQNTINQSNGSLYPLGTITGITIYVDPNMTFDDNRILIGRKGNDDEPGVKFMPYLMAESIQTISEGTMSPKIAVKSRYALVDAGHHPETQYYTIYIHTGTTTII